MSIKIKVSYTDQEELKVVTKLLQPKINKVKLAKDKQAPYKKAYIELKE